MKKDRFTFFALLTGFLVFAILGRFIYLSLFTQKREGTVRSDQPIVERGPILDRNGRVLAIQTQLFSVTAWMPNVKEKDETARILANELSLDYEDLKEKFAARNGFLYVKRKITPKEAERIKEFKDQDKLAGISLEPDFGRSYPEKTIAAQVLGFVGTDNVGLDGIELTFDEVLAPKDTAQTDHIYGNQVFLTLDLTIQYFAEKIVEQAMKENEADSAMLLVMEAKTGDILGWASHPTFDPNLFGKATKEEKRNRPATYAYEPGSVFKVFSIASILELGGINPESAFFCDGKYEKAFPNGEKVLIRCLGHHGEVGPAEIIKYSCNAGAGYASDTVEREPFYKMLLSFGFGSITGLPFPGETNGILQNYKYWSGRTKPTLAMGQEVSVSAVQVAAAATVFANDGVLLRPNIVKKIVSPEGRVLKEYGREPVRNVISPGNAHAMLVMMERATEQGGTAWRALPNGVRMSSKTGTAQVQDPKTGKYSEDRFIASCISVFPSDDPEIIVYLVIESPKTSSIFGSRIAAPLVRDIAEQIINYRGIARSMDTMIEHSGKVIVPERKRLSLGDVVPDFTGVPKIDLLPLLEEKNISVLIEGEGWVYSQSPAPGTPITKDLVLRLELR